MFIVISSSYRTIPRNINNNVKRVKLSKKSNNIELDIEQNFNNFDICFDFNRSFTDIEIEEILNKIWKPEPTFQFPNTTE